MVWLKGNIHTHTTNSDGDSSQITLQVGTKKTIMIF